MRQHGIPRRGRDGTRKISREELIDSIQRAAEEIDGVPSTADYQRHGEYCLATFLSRFGSWTDALLAAGVLGND
jgi:hypothetical protein